MNNKLKRTLINILEEKGFEVIVNDYRILVRTNVKDIIIVNNEVEKFLLLV